MNDWRLIPLLESSGAMQMAIDTWLLEQHRQGHQPSILRFYTWGPAALSLGHHQHRIPPHWNQIHWQGHPLSLVRRPSGGRAVLHQGDLTYAVITSGLGENRRASYGKICEFLIQGWQSLGIELHYGHGGRGYIHHSDCFGTATAADLVMKNGTKLIGSAQLRRGDTILQHGSMRLAPDPELFAQVFGQEPSPLPELSFAIQVVLEALITAASRCFGVNLVTEPLSEAEWQAISASLDLAP